MQDGKAVTELARGREALNQDAATEGFAAGSARMVDHGNELKVGTREARRLGEECGPREGVQVEVLLFAGDGRVRKDRDEDGGRESVGHFERALVVRLAQRGRAQKLEVVRQGVDLIVTPFGGVASLASA